MALGTVAPPAFAEDDETETRTAVNTTTENGWTFYPAVLDGSVTGVLAAWTAEEPAPGCFTVVWYERQSDGSFVMFGFTGGVFAAAQALSSGAPGMFERSGLWTPDTDLPEWGAEPGEFLATVSGIAESDPLSAVACFLTPAEMETIVQAGAQGATGLSAMEIEPVCEEEGDVSVAQAYLTHTANMFEAILSAPQEPDFAALATGDGFCGFCWPEDIRYSVTVSGPWSFTSENAGGGCDYSKTIVTVTTKCHVNVNCTLTGCTSTTTYNTGKRTCPKVGGQCPAKPSC